MESDIKKEDDLEKFWSYLNGGNIKGKLDQQKDKNEKDKVEQQTDTAINNNGGETFDANESKQDVNSQKKKSNEAQKVKVEFDLSKMLKTFEDIEAIGSSEELEPIELHSSSDGEESLTDRRNGETDVWGRKNKGADEVEPDRKQKEEEEEAATQGDCSGSILQTILPNGLGLNYNTLLSGGMVMALVLTVRLLFAILETIKEFLEYVAFCS